MKKINNIRGMYDIFGEEFSNHNAIKKKFSEIMELYNYIPFATPIMEYSEVFKRSLGDSSDVVMKEMYTFHDKSNDSVTLRPEGTAGIARAVISNGLTQNLPLKFYYDGPMFRYERPQKGRMRQFHQIGIECYSKDNFYADIEVIYIANFLLKKLKVLDKVTLKINTLGDSESRKNYKKNLISYFIKEKSKLSKDSVNRLVKNPLRILDSKDKGDKEVIKDSPVIYDYLTIESKNYYKSLKSLLVDLDIEFEENPLLVRGLDYYSNSIFEFTLKDQKDHAILAGGRYENLVENFGGPKLSGTGWAAGIERLASVFKKDSTENCLVLLIPLLEKCIPNCYQIRNKYMREHIKFEISNLFNLKKALKYANKINSSFVIIIGQSEIEDDSLTIKNLKTGKQASIEYHNIKEFLSNE